MYFNSDIKQWILCSKIDNINAELFKHSLLAKTVYNTPQFDKSGDPICHFQVLQTASDDSWAIIRAAVFAMEKCIELTKNNDLHQISLLIEVEQLGMFSIRRTSLSLEQKKYN